MYPSRDNRGSIPPQHKFNIFLKPKSYANQVINKESPGEAYSSRCHPHHIYLKHLTHYAIGIVNGTDGDCLSHIFIDGHLIGRFYIDSHSIIYIERPQHTNKALCFVAENSSIATQSGALPSHLNKDTGCIKVHLFPQDTSTSLYGIQKEYVSSAPTPGYDDIDCGTAKTFGAISEYGTNDQSTSTHESSKATRSVPPGISTVVEDGHRYGCASSDLFGSASGGTSAETRAFGGAPVTRPGVTVLGEKSSQNIIPAPWIRTKGHYIFRLKLVVGDPYVNEYFFLDKGTLNKSYCNLNNYSM